MPSTPMIDDPFGGRSVTEWVGKTPDSKVPDRVRDRIFARHAGRCHLTGRKIQAGEAWHLEHVKPLSMGGENREGNIAPALTEAHVEKSRVEASDRSKANRIRRKANGTWPKPVGNARIQSRGFAPGRNRSTQET